MDLKDLKELIALIQGTEVTEVELVEGDFRIRVKRGGSNSLPTYGSSGPSSEISESQKSASKEEAPPSLQEEQKHVLVRSPIVGTFYRSASPDSQPYIEVGDQVKKGQVVCIVEAMKLMNEIESELDGRVVEVCIEDSSPVEYGETLFKIEPLLKPA